MSTNVKTYVLYGALLPYRVMSGHYDVLEPYMDAPVDDLMVIYDGMNGQYVAVGFVKAQTTENNFFEEPITIDNLLFASMEYKIYKLLDELKVTSSAKWGWHIISHYH